MSGFGQSTEETGAVDDTQRRERDSAPVPQDRATNVDVSIIMPCLNEELSVGECVQKALAGLARSGFTGEVIVVDNGSTDRSAELAAEAGARVAHEAHQGYGNALLRGFREARGQRLVMGDCDGTYDFERLEPLLAPLSDGYDLVVGNRLGDMLAPGAMPWPHRFLGTPLITALVRLFSGAQVKDSQCGLRAIRREAFQRLDLKAKGMEFASEMILKASRQGLRVTEVPIPYYSRIGESKLNTFRDGWRHLKFLLISSPSYAFIGPGLLFVLLGLFALAVTVFTTSGLTVGSVTWEPIFAGAIFLVIGTNTMMLGVGSKLFAIHLADQEEDWTVRFYRRHLGLERLLAVAAGLAIIGLGMDGFILVEWFSDSSRDLLPLAAVAQSLIVVGANLAFTALLAAMIDYDYES